VGPAPVAVVVAPEHAPSPSPSARPTTATSSRVVDRLLVAGGIGSRLAIGFTPLVLVANDSHQQARRDPATTSTALPSARVGHEPEVDDLVGRLRAGGERVTTARRLVLAALVAARDEHASAEQLAGAIQDVNPEISLSTVYRTLDVLESAGLVIRAGFGDGTATTYHLIDDPHHHAVCDECGAVIHLPASSFDVVVRKLQRDHGFAAHPRHLTVGGICSTCR
jgi:Fur family transcriptional regulator, ferric uptake regulator